MSLLLKTKGSPRQKTNPTLCRTTVSTLITVPNSKVHYADSYECPAGGTCRYSLAFIINDCFPKQARPIYITRVFQRTT
jgi:hypothetical protein